MRPQDALLYELCVTLSGSLLMFLFHALVGLKSITWTLWMVSFTIVILSYIDHITIGWEKGRITGAGQIVRSLCNLGIGLVSAVSLRFAVMAFLPKDVDPHNLVSVLMALKRLYEIHSAWGAVIYSLFLIGSYTVFLSAIRAVLNLLYILGNAVWHLLVDEQRQRTD